MSSPPPEEKKSSPPPTTKELTPLEQDELTLRQTEAIEKEITTTVPHPISPIRTPLLPTLAPLYSGDPLFTKNLTAISKVFKEMRQTRPDGNCFYRGVLWGVFEKCCGNPEFFAKVQDSWKTVWKPLLNDNGYTQFTVEDFWENFGEALTTLSTITSPLDIHTTFFQSTPVTDYLTVFLRLLTAAELRRDALFYENFVTDGKSLDDFIKLEVEPMGKEADNLQIIALARALGGKVGGVRVVYLDRSDTTTNESGSGYVEHLFPDESENTQGEEEFYFVSLLYRPGHFDVVYK